MAATAGPLRGGLAGMSGASRRIARMAPPTTAAHLAGGTGRSGSSVAESVSPLG